MELYVSLPLLVTFCISCCLPGTNSQNKLRTVREWKLVDVAFPSNEAKRNALTNRDYIPESFIPIDVDVQHRRGSQSSRIFVTFPRFDQGRPVTLGELKSDGLIHGYPDYKTNANQGNNCDGLTSVFRVAIDDCNQLWVMDTGKIGDNQTCPPQLLAYNLDNNQIVFRHRFPINIYTPSLSLFVTPVVDTRSTNCDGTFVYVADVSQYGLVVVDVNNNRSWRVNHRLFYPYPNKGTFTIDGESFDLMDGVLGMALSTNTTHSAHDRLLYFHALASVTENVVRTSLLRNSSLIHSPDLDISDVIAFRHKRESQSAAEAIDNNGIMYFGAMEPPSILCWNTATEFRQANIHPVAVDRERLQFASGVKVVNNMKGEQELWILTSSFQRVMTGSLNNKRINFRIHAEKISELMRNSPCLNRNEGPPKFYGLDLFSGQRRSGVMYKFGVSSQV